MARFLHLIKHDSPSMAAVVVEQNGREPGAEVTVVLLDGTLPIPAGVTVKTLSRDLDYGQLLDLIFESDHVVTW